MPNWYPLIQEFTPETRFLAIDDLEQALSDLGWAQFFIKDYVKSLKTSVGSMIDDPAMIRTVVAEMQKFRGSIEGGLCVRQVEEFLPETEKGQVSDLVGWTAARFASILLECGQWP